MRLNPNSSETHSAVYSDRSPPPNFRSTAWNVGGKSDDCHSPANSNTSGTTVSSETCTTGVGVLDSGKTTLFDTTSSQKPYGKDYQEDVSKLYRPVPIIDEEGEFRDVDQSFRLAECTNFSVIAILGGQSSGKTTLLNALFGTTFETLPSSKAQCQTTRGIWLAEVMTMGSILLDTEGSDGMQHTNDAVLDRRIVVFVLSISTIILVNIWQCEIGRRHGSYYDLLLLCLSTQQELNELNKIERKTLIFVVRDWSESRGSAAKIENEIREMMKKLWASISPIGPRQRVLGEVFHIKVFPFHSFYEREAFTKDCSVLRSFIKTTARSSGNYVLPIAAFPQYARRIWDLVKASKQLRLECEAALIRDQTCRKLAKKLYAQELEGLKRQLVHSDSDDRLSWEHQGRQVPQIERILVKIFGEFEKMAEYFSHQDKQHALEELCDQLFALCASAKLFREESLAMDACRRVRLNQVISLETKDPANLDVIPKELSRWRAEVETVYNGESTITCTIPLSTEGYSYQVQRCFSTAEGRSKFRSFVSRKTADYLQSCAITFEQIIKSQTSEMLSDLYTNVTSFPTRRTYKDAVEALYQKWSASPKDLLGALSVRGTNAETKLKYAILKALRLEVEKFIRDPSKQSLLVRTAAAEYRNSMKAQSHHKWIKSFWQMWVFFNMSDNLHLLCHFVRVVKPFGDLKKSEDFRLPILPEQEVERIEEDLYSRLYLDIRFFVPGGVWPDPNSLLSRRYENILVLLAGLLRQLCRLFW